MELFSNQPGDDGLPGRPRLMAMLAVMTTVTMAVFDGSMVNIALPNIARALGVSASDAVWVANGYLLAAAMTLAIFAALATRLGFRQIFVFGLSLFTLASAGCALSTSLEMLVLMRILQGIGGAAVLSISPAILRSVFPTHAGQDPRAERLLNRHQYGDSAAPWGNASFDLRLGMAFCG